MCTLLALSALAWSAPPQSLDAALAWQDYGADAKAAAVAASHLKADPSDAAAHQVYITSRLNLDGREAVVQQYRGWASGDGDEPIRALGLAMALGARGSATRDDCAEVQALLASVEAPELSYWVHRGRLELEDTCKLDTSDDRAAIVSLGASAPAARALAWRLAVEGGAEVDEETADAITTWVQRDAARVLQLQFLWGAQGAGASRARREVLAVAKASAAEGDPAHWAAARRVLFAAAEDELAWELAERLDAALGVEPAVPGVDQGTLAEIDAASRSLAAQEVRASLEAIEERLPDGGPVRAKWHRAVAKAHDRMDEPVAAVRHARLAWSTDPGDPQNANNFAYSAAQHGLELGLALEAAEVAVAWHRQAEWNPGQGMAFETWKSEVNLQLAQALDTRGWVRHARGEEEAAERDLVEAMRLADDEIFDLHLGLTLAAQGRLDDAAAHLATGMSAAGSNEASARQAREIVTAWYATGSVGHPGGVDGWGLDLRTSSDPAETDAAPEHSLLGQAAPVLRFSMGGVESSLADIEGPVVLDFWATWCGPCVAGLPKLEGLAADHPEVTVLAVSLDEKPSALRRFFRDAGDLPYQVAWAGEADAYSLFEFQSIPAKFVLDADHRVVAFVSGFTGEDDGRLALAVAGLMSGTAE